MAGSADIVVGVEGGATRSNVTLFNAEFAELASATGGSLNHYLVGVATVAQEIYSMITRARDQLKMPRGTFKAIGLTLSGAHDEEFRLELISEFEKLEPNLASFFYVCNDTLGSLFALAPSGGICLIARTGSNALLVNPNGSSRTSGGWGHLLGDEGGAYSIAHMAIKAVMDQEDGYVGFSPHLVSRNLDSIKQAMFQYFKIKDIAGLLEVFYKRFDKAHIAGFTKELSLLAQAGDGASAHLFEIAGYRIGLHLRGLLSHADPGLRDSDGLIPVVMVGSVFQSRLMLYPGIARALEEKQLKFDDLKFCRLEGSAALGAARLAHRECTKIL